MLQGYHCPQKCLYNLSAAAWNSFSRSFPLHNSETHSKSGKEPALGRHLRCIRPFLSPAPQHHLTAQLPHRRRRRRGRELSQQSLEGPAGKRAGLPTAPHCHLAYCLLSGGLDMALNQGQWKRTGGGAPDTQPTPPPGLLRRDWPQPKPEYKDTERSPPLDFRSQTHQAFMLHLYERNVWALTLPLSPTPHLFSKQRKGIDALRKIKKMTWSTSKKLLYCEAQ